ncbi:BTAD domain-containing putative transcriptional regulator [Sphaerisporangium aureirubrum]|uniref:BTAD domain-containing putative transcriptional regulator n=1 Tax=Sphaerisporangium aureirubrum TaxID=1544736 RepID=A0ABW1NKR5_9ACTN
MAVLGPVEVRRDGARLVVPSGKTTEVLVRLALDAGVLVRAERLIEDLWSDQAGGVARNTLQSKVSKLRRVLGDPGLVTGGGAGYTLAVDPGRVDALEVLRLAESAASLRHAGDPAAAVRACATALAMFRGELLPGAGDGAWLAPHRARLEEARLRLTEDHLAARCDLGAAGELIGELEGLVEAHPLREGLWKLLITALYRAGRQADALAAYRRVQRRLSDELGLDPGAELRALEQRILRHDVSAAGPARGDVSAAGPVRGNLPGLSASLIGRDADLAAVGRLLGDQRLVTVAGPAGVGKTRLAIEVARGCGAPGGAWLVRLESTRPGASLWQSVGEAFGVSAATEAMVLDRLRGSGLLLVLDNCEHLVETLPEAVGRMVSAAPGLRVLATSQVPLGMDGEAVYPLEPLTIADSVELFTRRAARQRRSFRLDAGTGPVVEAVCRSLDGLPLAIELAAARAKVLSVQEIARRLDDRFTLLTDPTSHRPPRRRTLWAAIAWSYDLLFPDDQRGLWAFACFSDGAPLPAVEDVLAALGVPPASAVDVVTRLADRSLVGVDAGPGGTVRYRLLDSVRAFCLDKLNEAGMADAALGAHAAWFAAAADRAGRGARGSEQAGHLALVRTERANIDAALTWAGTHDPPLGLRIAGGLGWSWAILGAGPDAARRVRAALTSAGTAAPARDRANALLLAGFLEASGGDLDLATADIEQAARVAGDEQRAVGRLYLSFVRSQQGRAEDALVLLAGCRADFRRLGRVWEEGASWLLSAWAEIALGATDRGKAACDEALRLLGPLGDQWALNHLEAMLGGLAQAEHRFADATAHLRRAADATHKLGFAAAEAHHLAGLGRAQHQSGDHRAAIATLERAIETAHATGDLRTVAAAGLRLGRVLRSAGERRPAREVVRSARSWYAAAGGGDAAVPAEYVLAALDADDGAPHAVERLSAVVAAARHVHDAETEVLALDALAHLHAEQGRTGDARAALDAADLVMPAARHLVTDGERIDRDRARSLLGAAGP